LVWFKVQFGDDFNDLLNAVSAVLGDVLNHTLHAPHIAPAALVGVNVSAQRGYLKQRLEGGVEDCYLASRLRILCDGTALR
jgi:hypothetical protein